jgi:hypothetical protein
MTKPRKVSASQLDDAQDRARRGWNTAVTRLGPSTTTTKTARKKQQAVKAAAGTAICSAKSGRGRAKAGATSMAPAAGGYRAKPGTPVSDGHRAKPTVKKKKAGGKAPRPGYRGGST